jgi:phospholipase/lecithinase/hemolysin
MARLLLRRVLVVAFLFLLVACSSSSSAGAAAAETTVDGITAIYNFGDSITDTGNLIREDPTGLLRYIGKLPYGIDLHGPTGRCSNGYLMIDFLGTPPPAGYFLRDFNSVQGHLHDTVILINSYICAAKYLGLPLLNPYLDKAADFTHGVNFAVAGATALDTTTLAERGVTISLTNSSLDVQLAWFKDFLASATNSSSQGTSLISSLY